MIVLSAGMQKAGTGWFFNMTNDLVAACGGQDVRHVRSVFGLDDILKYHNCNLEKPDPDNLDKLELTHAAGYTFVVKSHGGPEPYLSLISKRILRATYIYRDPRDAVLSAFDHGEKIRGLGQQHTFGGLTTMMKSVDFVGSLLSVWESWYNLKCAFMVRYEDLISKPAETMMQLAAYLDLNPSKEIIEQAVSAYRPSVVISDEHKTDYLHFNLGQVGRWKTLMGKQEIDHCKDVFGDRLLRMGYSWE